MSLNSGTLKLKRFFTRNLSRLSIRKTYVTHIKKLTMRAVSVEIAAPLIPSSGKPRFPKISTQLRKTFVASDIEETNSDIRTAPTARKTIIVAPAIPPGM
jgi:hypothetical protein